MAITPESGSSRQRGLFNDPEVGTEAHDDILAWAVSTSGRKAIAQHLVLAPLAATCDFKGDYSVEVFKEGHELRFVPGVGRYIWFARSGEGFRIESEELTGQLEVPMRGKNGYFIGFADAIVSGAYHLSVPSDLYPLPHDYWDRTYIENQPSLPVAGRVDRPFKILIEVKTGRVQLGEVLRQLNTYNTLGTFSHRLLIAKQRPPEHYIEALQGEGIRVALFSDYSLEWLTGEA